jgi:hypothetical protein
MEIQMPGGPVGEALALIDETIGVAPVEVTPEEIVVSRTSRLLSVPGRGLTDKAR